jgi:hypothetical protein
MYFNHLHKYHNLSYNHPFNSIISIDNSLGYCKVDLMSNENITEMRINSLLY